MAKHSSKNAFQYVSSFPKATDNNLGVPICHQTEVFSHLADINVLCYSTVVFLSKESVLIGWFKVKGMVTKRFFPAKSP